MNTANVNDPVLDEFVGPLVRAYEPDEIYLFGSRARGDNRPDSDYDLMVVVPDSASDDRRDCRLGYDALSGSGAYVDVVVMPRERFDRQAPVVASLPATVLREGRLLYRGKRPSDRSKDTTGHLKEANGLVSPEEEKLRLTREWLEKAAEDLEAAERMSQPPALTGVVAYHCQQAMEKALKGYLLWHDQPFRMTHELIELLKQCVSVDAAFASLEDNAKVLAPYVAQFRYPMGVPHATPEEAATALALAREAVAFVEARLPARST